jgi:hypothetical protein
MRFLRIIPLVCLIVVALAFMNYMLPLWIKTNPEKAWSRIVYAAAKENEKYVIGDYEAVKITGLSRVWIDQSAWDILLSCPRQELTSASTSITDIIRGNTVQSEIQVIFSSFVLQCYSLNGDKNVSYFRVYRCTTTKPLISLENNFRFELSVAH